MFQASGGGAVRQGLWFYVALAVAGLSCLSAEPADAQSIGNARSVTNQVDGIVRGAARTLAAGSDVFTSEVIRTGDAATAQLVFLDNTNLNVGPRSSVTLDRFVYNPDRNTGRFVVRASRGVFRFVTGSQPPRDYTIRTPIATIGVRGTVFDLLVDRDKIVVVLVEGAIVVTTAQGRSVTLTVAGTAVTIYAGGRISGPAPWTGTIFDTASNAPFPYFGSVPIALGMGGLQPFVGLEGGVRGTTTRFDVMPPFDVDSTIGVAGFNGGFLYMLPDSKAFVGPRVGALFGFGSGSITSPPASPAFTYKVEMPWTLFYEAMVGTDLGTAPFGRDTRIHASLGGATTHTTVTGTAPGFTVESSATRTGVTASIGLDFEVMPSLFVGGQFRYINVPTGDVLIPGLVPISGNSYIGTLTLTKPLP
jgi:hypothetical protein